MFTEFRDLVLRSRSRRRFNASRQVTLAELRELVDLARLSPSGGNLQPLKYMLTNTPEGNARVFRYVSWAGYLKDWPGPAEGERPSACIVVLVDRSIAAQPGCDHGIAAQSILLGAAARGLGGCIMGAVDRKGLRAEFGIPAQFDILLVLAIGEPAEEVLIEPMKERDVKYWRDAAGRHHVPKRSLDEIVVDFGAGAKAQAEGAASGPPAATPPP